MATLLVITTLLVLAFGSGVAYSWSALNFLDNVTFFSGGTPKSAGTNGYNPRNYIEVWRPTGDNVGLCYREGGDNSGVWVCGNSNNASDNPVKWTQSDPYAKAFCSNQSTQENDIHPMTCQTTTP